MRKISSFLFTFIVTSHLAQVLSQGMLYATRSLSYAVLNQNEETQLTIFFRVSNVLPANSYITVELPDYGSPGYELSTRHCQISYSGAASYTIETCGVMSSSSTTVYVLLSQALSNLSTSENILQIDLSTLNPLKTLSQSIRVSTVSSIGTSTFLYDQNINFAQIPFTSALKNSFKVTLISFGTSGTQNTPGMANQLVLQIEINIPNGIEAKYSRIKLVAPSPWTFSSVFSIVATPITRVGGSSTDSGLYAIPNIITDNAQAYFTQIESASQLSIVFKQALLKGSSFILTINSLVNPTITSSGYLKVYSMPVGSNEALEGNNSLLWLSTQQTPLTISLLTSLGYDQAQGIQFYKNTKQYLIVKIELSVGTTIPDNSVIQITFSKSVTIIQGTLFIDKNMVDIQGRNFRSYSYSGTNSIFITELAQIVGSSTLTYVSIKTRAFISKTEANISASVIVYSDSTKVNAILSGSTSSLPVFTNSNASLLTQIYDSQLGINNYARIAATNNDLIFYLSPSTYDYVSSSSILDLFLSPLVTFEAALVCYRAGTVFASCTVTTTTDYIRIRMISPLSTGSQQFRLLYLKFPIASNHETATYQAFFRLYKYPTNLLDHYLDCLVPLNVISLINSNANLYYINNIYQTSSVDYTYPSFIRVNFLASALSSFSLSSNQKVFVTVYAMGGYSSIVQTPTTPQDQFSCGSTLIPFSCYYFSSDSTTTLNTLLFREWARVTFFLPSSAVSSPGFQLVIPYLFSSSSTHYFNLEIGIYTTTTYTYASKHTQYQQYSQYTPSYTIASIAGTCSQTSITLAGYAGSSASGVSVSLISNGGFSLGSAKDTSAIIVTDWQFWIQGTSIYSTSYAIVGNNNNAPVSVSYTDLSGVTRYAVVFILLAAPTTLTTIQVSYVTLPYTYDLPNLIMILTADGGVTNCSKQYINSGMNSFYTSPMQTLSMSCVDQSDGVTNTICTISFQPSQMIQIFAVIRANLFGMQVYTDTCWLYQITTATSAQTIMNQSCTVSSDGEILDVSLKDKIVWSNDNTLYSYQLSFYGAQTVVDSSVLKRVILEIRDSSKNFIIETNTVIMTTLAYTYSKIIISSVKYSLTNPQIYSKLSVEFTTPRNLQVNENLNVSLGTDLIDVNQNTSRLSITLCIFTSGTTCTLIPMTTYYSKPDIVLNLNSYTSMIASKYQLVIDGIYTPASNSNDKINIKFIRKFDSAIVLQTDSSSTIDFPILTPVPSTNIVLNQTYFYTEGALQELYFNLSTVSTQINSLTKMYFYFPSYYQPALNTNQKQLYCKLNTIEISCKYQSTPFRLELKDSPILVQPTQNFTLFLSGIVTPSYGLRYNAQYVNETILFALDTGLSNSFAEYTHITPPPVSQLPTNFPYLRLVQMNSTDYGTLSFAKHTLQIESEAAIISGYMFKILFPDDFTSLKIVQSLSCQVSYSQSTSLIMTDMQICQVKGLSIEGTFPMNLSSNNIFFISILDIPTPSSQVSVASSMTSISIFNSSKLNYIAATNSKVNRGNPLNYLEESSSISINANNIIQVTKGSYSDLVNIAMSDGSKFSNSYTIGYEGEGFTVEPEIMTLLLGDAGATFRVGAQSSLMEKEYSIKISSKAISSSSYPSQLIVYVVSAQVQIITPSTIQLPYGGCSLPVTVSIVSPPYDDMTLSLQYDSFTYPEEQLLSNFQISSFALDFENVTTFRYISLCSTDQFPLSTTSIPLTYSIQGTNSNSYAVSNPTTTITMTTVASTSPTLVLSATTIGRTTTTFTANINVDGTIYYQLFVFNTAIIKDLSIIKRNIKFQTTIVQTKSTLTEQVMGKKNDERMGMVSFRTTDVSKTFTLNKLIPQTKYKLCHYLESEMGLTTSSNCILFTTNDWLGFPKATFFFSKNVYSDQMNDFLCFFVSALQTSIYNVVSSDGSSCSRKQNATPYYFEYSGKTASQTQLKTSFYLVPDSNQEVDSSVAIFSGFFDPVTKAVIPSFLLTASFKGIDFLQTGSYEYSFTYSDALIKQNKLSIPTIVSITFKSVAYETSTSIEIQNISLSTDGQIYFIAEIVEAEVYEPSTQNFFTSSLLVGDSPTPYQIASCLNAINYQPDLCGRAIYNNQQPVTLVFEGLIPAVNYRFYYVIANQFPLAPVLDSKVNKKEIMALTFLSTFSYRISFTFVALLYILFL